ncbi:hypothetical protein MKA38_08735 [[Clostridium] innocuum]|nr:hypothetical protein [[Clostridium] innocuum]
MEEKESIERLVEGYKYKATFQVIKRIQPNSKEASEPLSRLPWITDNFDEDE